MRTRGSKGQGSPRTTRLASAVATAAMFFMPFASASMFGDFDARGGSVEPNGTQLGMVSSMGANASWNHLGTPSSLIKYGDYLATDLQGPDATTVARNWVNANKALFRLSSVDSLTMISDEAFPHSEAYAVSFRQEVGGLRAAEDGLLTVGIVGNAHDGWKIGYVSATTTGDATLSGDITMTAADAYVIAAQDIGKMLQVSDIVTTKIDGEWSTFNVNGFADVQRARVRALPTPNNGVRPVYETVYIENASTAPRAYVHYIDAADGTVWMRKDIVEEAHEGAANLFSGSLPANDDGACELSPAFNVTAPGVGTIAYSAGADLPANDVVIELWRDGVVVSSQDTGTSPEANVYSPTDDGVGSYQVNVCDYVDGAGWTVLTSYTGQISFFDQGASDAPVATYPPKWNVFPANPVYGSSVDSRSLWCWENLDDPNCDLEVINFASRTPWDYDAKTNTPTFTTRGNNAIASEAWVSPLTPGGTVQPPVDGSRNYDFEWTNAWAENKCTFTPTAGANDISAAITNLFVMHNRMHDFSYELGFTERRWNAQSSNFGNNTPGTLENDPVIGNAQAGAASGGYPSYLGRDNANMITLQDGISPITNMYLWQPIAGAFYAPCSDGDYDMAIIGHEYGHMIENRMIGKGDGRSGHHAGAMGESFGDLVGMEIINEYDFAGASGENPFSVGGFATGNGERAIRNFNMSYPRTGAFPEPGLSTTGSGDWMGTAVNPLNFSNMGYDLTGPQVHADGEIWSATNFTIRQILTAKYEATHPYGDLRLQKECADGERSASECPGNRRWMQTVFDAMLLMPTAPTMLQARDAYLAADMMRYDNDHIPDNTNQAELWLGFAQRGMGSLADAKGNGTANPIPDFSSPYADNASITFNVVDENGIVIPADIIVGHYEARVSPIADTRPGVVLEINRDEVAAFVPEEYEFVVRADGFGHFRFRETFAANDVKILTITMPTNYASATHGGSASGAGTEHGALIDDTEATNWDKAPDGIAVNVGQPAVTVDLAGAAHTINRVQVSAMLSGTNRFTALREFKIQTSTNGVLFQDWITSGPNAFPGHTPRPVSPEMMIRSFEGEPRQASHVRIIALNNQCTGNPAFQDPDQDPLTPDHDNDPLNTSDCRVGVGTAALGNTLPFLGGDELVGATHDSVYIAELQVFDAEGSVECTMGCEVNSPPVADDDSATTPEGTSVTIDVLDGDTDADGDTLTVVPGSVSMPTNGTATDNGDGTVTYTPNAGFTGTDSFTYEVTDGQATDEATVTVTVTPVTTNNPPVADDDSATTPQGTSVTIDVLDGDTDADGDTLTVVPGSVSMPTNGTATDNGDGTVTYTPNAGFTGTDSFTYEVTDGQATDEGTVTVTVTPVTTNNPPVADDDSATTPEGMSVTIDVLDGDTDADGDTLTVVPGSVSMPTNGTATDNGDGTVTYTPNAGFTGPDSFTYEVTDGQATDEGTVTVTVTGGPGGNVCVDDDSDSDSDQCKVKGDGKFDDGVDNGYDAEFKVEAYNYKGNVKGKLYFDTKNPDLKVRGEPNFFEIVDNKATVRGTCEYEVGDANEEACTYEVKVTDGNPDTISVLIMDGSTIVYNTGSEQPVTYGKIELEYESY